MAGFVGICLQQLNLLLGATASLACFMSWVVAPTVVHVVMYDPLPLWQIVSCRLVVVHAVHSRCMVGTNHLFEAE